MPEGPRPFRPWLWAALCVAVACHREAPAAAPPPAAASPSSTASAMRAPPQRTDAGAEPSQGGGHPGSTEGTPLARLSGQASYYGDSLAGHRTANGERYDPRALTAAHRSLPFGTVVRVVRKDGRASVIVRINDRGPFGSSRRIIDLSRAAAEHLQMLRAGVVDVHLEVLAYGKNRRRKR